MLDLPSSLAQTLASVPPDGEPHTIDVGRLGAYRALAIVPWAMPEVVVGIMWRITFNPDAGILNETLRDLGFGGDRDWLSGLATALPAVIVVGVWAGMPQTTVALLAGLQNTPRELHEAAAVDGAGWWARFRHITWPALRPVTAVIVAMTVLWELKIFDLVYTATQGGPGGATMVLALQMYFYGFRSLDPHRAAAVATLLTLSTLAIGVWFLRTAEGGERA